jgi:nucleotide-binding universal stress UspA family protein
VRRIAVPLDLSPAAAHQVEIASRIAITLNLPLLLIHVIEPVKSRLLSALHVAGLNANRRAAAEDGLQQLIDTLPEGTRAEALVVYGDPAEEAAKVIHDRGAGLVVMGLHGSPQLGPRMGSVTYRIVCLCAVPVLAVPPQHLTPEPPPEVSSATRELS